MNGFDRVVLVAITRPIEINSVQAKLSLNNGGGKQEQQRVDPTRAKRSKSEKNILLFRDMSERKCIK
jgi:hypothetical protein